MSRPHLYAVKVAREGRGGCTQVSAIPACRRVVPLGFPDTDAPALMSEPLYLCEIPGTPARARRTVSLCISGTAVRRFGVSRRGSASGVRGGSPPPHPCPPGREPGAERMCDHSGPFAPEPRPDLEHTAHLDGVQVSESPRFSRKAPGASSPRVLFLKGWITSRCNPPLMTCGNMK